MISPASPELHVIFGSGAVGSTLMDRLASEGKRVRVVNRRGLRDLPAGAESLPGDIADLDFARQAGTGATHIYATYNAPYDQWTTVFPALQRGAI
jgi:nucleoside-diphosphate-sugar epimerase